MSSIQEYFKQAELALAAYATLGVGRPNPGDLTNDSAGMTSAEAAKFAEEWEVVDQFVGTTGVSATIFEKDGQKYLAIRGTEFQAGDIAADGTLALGVPSHLNPQYSQLKSQVQNWIETGLLAGGCTVSGHSLGGYLATALKEDFPSNITDAYLFNAPGIGSVFGNVAGFFQAVFGDAGAPGEGGIWNIKGTEGLSIITGLGYQPSQTIPIQIEAAPGAGLNNHSIKRLVGSLAVHALYADIWSDLEIADIGRLIDASGVTETSLEPALDALRKLVNGNDITPTAGDLFETLYKFRTDGGVDTLQGTTFIPLFENPAQALIAKAQGDGDEGLAVRYALLAMNLFAVVGADYSRFNGNGELALYDPATGTGNLTEDYLKDRAAFAERKYWFNVQDKNPVNPAVTYDGTNNHSFENEATYFEDKVTGYKIAQGTINDVTKRYLFGGEKADALTGEEADDRLYGGAGDDKLTGNAGNDYIEGGHGLDTYRIQTGDGHDTILDSDGGLITRDGGGLSAGTVILTKNQQWRSEDGQIVYTKNGKDLQIAFQDNAADSIAIKNFDFDAALGVRAITARQAVLQTAGAKSFGIRLAPHNNVVIAATADQTENLSRQIGYTPDPGQLEEGGTVTLTAFVSEAAGYDRSLVLKLAGGTDYKLCTGADFLDFAGGEIRLDLPAGKTAVTFALVTSGDIDADASLQLTATLDDPEAPSGAEPVEGSLAVNVAATAEPAADERPVIQSTPGNGDWLINAGAAPGIEEPSNQAGGPVRFVGGEQGDSIIRGHSSDIVEAGGGNDWIGHTDAPVIDGPENVKAGDGDDLIDAGSGSDLIQGGAGDDAVWDALKSRRWQDGTKTVKAACRSASVRIIKVGAGGTAGNDREWRAAA